MLKKKILQIILICPKLTCLLFFILYDIPINAIDEKKKKKDTEYKKSSKSKGEKKSDFKEILKDFIILKADKKKYIIKKNIGIF